MPVLGHPRPTYYDATGWIETIPMGDVLAGGFEALHAGTKMKVLVDPSR